MKVLELIQRLQHEDPDAEVRMSAPAHDYGRNTLALRIDGLRPARLRDHSSGGQAIAPDDWTPDEDDASALEVLLLE